MTRESLARALGGRPFRFFTSLDSTNSEARRWLAAVAAGDRRQGSERATPRSGTVIVADEQTAGRGRFSRGWLTPAGSAVAMSVLLRDPVPSKVAVAAGLAVSDAVSPLVEEPVWLKWPNDVELAGRKVAGILSESIHVCGAQWIIVGIGINVNVDFAGGEGEVLQGEGVDAPAEELSVKATSLSAHRRAGRSPIDREALIATVADRLETRLSEEGLIEAWKARLSTIGRAVRIGAPTGVVEGTAVDVDNEGCLVVRDTNGRLRSFAAGDVTVIG